MKKFVLIALLLWSVNPLCAQSEVTGTVTSAEDGQPLPYVTIQVKGRSGTGTLSDIDGNYKLSGCPSNATLLFSYVGYVTQEISLEGRSLLHVILTPDATALEEVMVVAYGTAKKGTYTGAASLVKSDAIKDVPAVSFENALNGKVAGMQITASSGQAGSASSIRIRGIGSMNASNEPLYVIDGVPVVSGDIGQMSGYTYSTNNVMSSLNPSDIESITVLKDAAASALYGSRAANGVVMITTKKGKMGRPTVNFKASVGITPSWATDNYETASVQENVNMLYMVFHDYNTSLGKTEAYANANALSRMNTKWKKHGYYFETAGTGLYENVRILGMTDGAVNREGTYFDWDDAYFRTAVYQNYDLSVSGGDQNTNYYTSLSYTKEQGRIYVNDFDRFSGRVNLSQKVGKHVEFTTNINLSKSGRSGYNDTRNTGGNYFLQSRNLLWGLYWPTDYKTGDPWTARYGSYAYNGLYYNKEWENTSGTLKIQASETLNVTFTPWLNFKSLFSYDNTQVKDHIYYSANHYNGSSTNGSVSEMTSNYNKIVSSSTLNFNKDFGKHAVSALAGFEAERNQTDFMRSTGEDLPSSTLHTVATAGTLDANAYSWGNSMVSILSRAEYNYDQRYFASASYRRDGSSRLGPEARWGDFWSVAGSWKISNEAFMKNVPVISDLRLRASYGVNGTLPSTDYGWRSLTGYSSKYQEQAGGGLSNAADAKLSWETSYTSNLALEFGLWGQRLTGIVEYFNRDSKDLLQDVPISTVTGFGSTLKNIGRINNRGVEVELAGDIIRTSSVRWSAGANASFTRSTVTELYAGADINWYDPTGDDDRAMYLYREGESTLSFYGYEYAGVDPANGKSIFYVNDTDNPAAGDFTWNGRGATYDKDNANYTILGSALPKVFGGLNTEVEWKGISLGLNFIYKIGGYLYDGANKDVADDGYYWERIRSKYYYDHMWTPTHTTGGEPRIEGTDLTDAMAYSSRQMHNASFLRLKTLTLAYRLPSGWVHKAGMSGARVYFNGSNLFTCAEYKLADPEVNAYGTRGWETPIGKTYTFGIEISF